jgi:hypothetical protein
MKNLGSEQRTRVDEPPSARLLAKPQLANRVAPLASNYSSEQL